MSVGVKPASVQAKTSGGHGVLGNIRGEVHGGALIYQEPHQRPDGFAVEGGERLVRLLLYAVA